MGVPASRRDWLKACLGSLALTGVPGTSLKAAQSAASTVGPAWPIFRGDPALTGVGASPLPAAPKLLWSFETESEPASPVIQGDRVVVATRDGDLISLDLATGKAVWRGKVEAGFEGAPTLSSTGLVLAPDLEGTIHAFAAADGKKVWSHVTEEKSEIKASVAIAGSVAIVGSYDGTLHALNLTDGARRWTHESAAQIHATCAILNGLAFVAGCDGHFRGLDVSTGAVKIDVRFGGYTAASPAIAEGIAVFGTFSNDVVAIDLAKKTVIWRYTPKKQFPFYSSAAISGGLAFVGSRDKALHVLDLRTGTLQWTFDTQGKIDSSPVIEGSRVFFGSHDGRIRGVDVKTRQSVFSYETGAPVATSPALSGSRLLVAATDGRILCFG
ncbi:MAG: PQQ-binding-like beta-propeller repeat protein [Vicinamibacteria bacterium]|nr:PQQ-binding-like beta-propeller repeat protein [Vicinamibacteria bacterium]